MKPEYYVSQPQRGFILISVSPFGPILQPSKSIPRVPILKQVSNFLLKQNA